MTTRKLISFDWAMKRLLRSKANFGILEGFLSELLNDDIRIQEILESESNKDSSLDKYNRVDLKVRNQANELVIIEVQYERQYDYLQRMLYGTSRAITEHQQEGDEYGKVVKLISVNILFFDLGVGKDYLYHGTTHFTGIHEKDQLLLSERQQALYGKKQIYELFPEYYLLRINNFDDVARTPLDEWFYFLKNEKIQGNVPARGLREAERVFQLLNLSEEERIAYNRYQDERRYQASMMISNFDSGRLEGRKEGLLEGRKEGLQESLASALRLLLTQRFGEASLTSAVTQRIESASLEDLNRWMGRVFQAEGLEDVFAGDGTV